MISEKFDSSGLLRTQVYKYLREQFMKGRLKPGMVLSISKIAKSLELSRTPLRDALLQLQVEGFLTLLPQRGIRINKLTPQDIKNTCEVLGALDSHIMLSVFDRLGLKEIDSMKKINDRMWTLAGKKEYYKYWELNIKFHNVYSKFSYNPQMQYYIDVSRQRLFGLEVEWGENLITLNHNEHLELISLITAGKSKKAAAYLREVHDRLP